MRIAAALILAGAISLVAPGAAWSQAAATKGAAAPQAAPAAPAPAVPAPAAAPVPAKAACANPDALGIARVVEIDTTGGPGFGFEHFKQLDFLRDKEVVLTFDDGPWPVNTPSVLKSLADQCTTGIFFSIGKHATYYPEILKQVLAAGHTDRVAHLVACDADRQEADRTAAQGRDRKRIQRREMGAGRRFARAILPLPGAAASAGNGDVSRHPEYRDVLVRSRLVRLQGAQSPAGDRRDHEEARQARQRASS